MYCKSSNAQCAKALQCTKEVPRSTTLRYCGTILRAPLPTAPGSVVVFCRSTTAAKCRRPSTACCPNAMSAQNYHCQFPVGSEPQELHCPLHQCNVAICRTISTAHCPKAARWCTEGDRLPNAPWQRGGVTHKFHCPRPQAVWECNTGDPSLTTPRQWIGALHEFRCPLPQGTAAECGRQSTAHCPKARSP